MTTKLGELMAQLSAADRREVEKRARGHLKAMADARRLDEIRSAANKTQADIARAMGIGQNAVSQLEKRNDLQLSTLNRYVESVGFRLEVTIVSQSGERVALENFRPWEQVRTAARKTTGTKRLQKAPPRPRSGTALSRDRAAAAKGTSKGRKAKR
jgi:transcriptional regulator with XRE-family HTH domain